MKGLGLRKPVVGEFLQPLPCELVLLTAPSQRAQPEASNMVAERTECRHIRRNGVIREVTPDDLAQPFALFGNWLMHASSQFLLDLLELRLHSITPGFPLNLEFAFA